MKSSEYIRITSSLSRGIDRIGKRRLFMPLLTAFHRVKDGFSPSCLPFFTKNAAVCRLSMTLLMVFAFAASASAQGDRQFIRQGNRLYRQGAYDKAEVEYRKALSQNGANPQALYNLGCALMMQNKDSAAIVQYERAAKVETSKMRKSKSFHNIGVICQKHQLYGDAVKAYEESLRNNPSDNETRYNLALCKRQQKNQKNQGGGQNNKDNKDKQKQKDKQQQKQNQDKQQQQKQQRQQEQMSKENAEQLLNAAMQEEQATQRRIKDKMRQSQTRQLPQNW